jgi:uncharacterized membrane protein YtjA (UPF0391 family)
VILGSGIARITGTHLTVGDDHGRLPMLYWSVVFLVIALIAGAFGFGGVAGTAASIAQVFFTLFLIIFLVSLVMGIAVRGRAPRPPI